MQGPCGVQVCNAGAEQAAHPHTSQHVAILQPAAVLAARQIEALGLLHQLSAAQSLSARGGRHRPGCPRQYPGAHQTKHALLSSLEWGRQHCVVVAR